MPRGPVWPLEADEWLKAIPLGTLLITVARRYNETARKRGWPIRSRKAVELRWRFLVPRAKGTARRIPVFCTKTCQHYPSISAAARAHGRSIATVDWAIRNKGHWGSIIPVENLGEH
jgi:hypothetical protein